MINTILLHEVSKLPVLTYFLKKIRLVNIKIFKNTLTWKLILSLRSQCLKHYSFTIVLAEGRYTPYLNIFEMIVFKHVIFRRQD